MLFNIKQITNIKVTNDYNKAFEANFNDFIGYNQTSCYRECSRHGRCVASENKRFFYCECIESRFGVACNLNKEMYDLLLNIQREYSSSLSTKDPEKLIVKIAVLTEIHRMIENFRILKKVSEILTRPEEFAQLV